MCGVLEENRECKPNVQLMNSSQESTPDACQNRCQWLVTFWDLNVDLNGNICCQWNPLTDSCDIFQGVVSAANGMSAAACKPGKRQIIILKTQRDFPE